MLAKEVEARVEAMAEIQLLLGCEELIVLDLIGEVDGLRSTALNCGHQGLQGLWAWKMGSRKASSDADAPFLRRAISERHDTAVQGVISRSPPGSLLPPEFLEWMLLGVSGGFASLGTVPERSIGVVGHLGSEAEVALCLFDGLAPAGDLCRRHRQRSGHWLWWRRFGVGLPIDIGVELHR